VVASASFKELAQIQTPKVKIIFWDKGILQRATAKVLGRLFPSRYIPTGNYLLSQFMPSRWLRARLGNLKAIWESLGDVDAIWAPHFTIGGGVNYLSLFRNLSSVRAPVLLTIHDIHPVFFPDDWPPESLARFWKEFVPFAQRSRSIITHSQFQKTAIVEHLKVDPGKISVTHCPPLVDQAALLQIHEKTEIEALLSRYCISLPFVLYPASTTHTHKNHTRLLLAWAELQRHLGIKCPTLVCTAKGHLWPALKALIEALELQGKVVFTGLVDTDALAKLYQSCAFVIVPTLYEGGGSGPVAEAILAGKPVVCSKIPQIEEQLHSYGGYYATFFPPHSVDAIALTIESALERLPDLESQAKENQKRLLAGVPKLWEEWARFYTEQIRNMVTS
jgi:glycosyltransferase involved in cell wall biosynthesis